MSAPLLRVDELVVEFPRGSACVRAADGVSFEVGEGEVVGLVGESGCGKSATALALFKLLPAGGRIVSGRVFLGDVELSALEGEALRRHRGSGIAYVPQEPGEALNPVVSVGTQIVDVIRAHRSVSRKEAWGEAVEGLRRVGIPDPDLRAKRYAHEFSGGMKQRVLIAMALAARPRVLIADEPTTALDVTLQAGILDLLEELAARGLGVLLITHDLGVVASVCRRVLVMYAGRIIESAGAEELFAQPRHPYTRALLSAHPSPDVARGELPAIQGTVPDLAELPHGCAFHPRCSLAIPACETAVPNLVGLAPGVRAACIVAQESAAKEAGR